jgi:hypothetical protein
MVWRPNRLVLGPRKHCLLVLLTGYLLVYSAAGTRCQELFRRSCRSEDGYSYAV